MAMVRVLVVFLLALAIAAPADAVPLKRGSLKLTVDNTFGVKLVKQGIDAAPLTPGAMDGLGFTFPVTGGKTRARGSTVRTSGGIDLENVASGPRVRLSGLVATERRGRVDVSGLAEVDALTTDEFVVFAGRAESVKRTKRGVVIRRIALGLTEIGEVALNTQFETDVFAAGEPIGFATVRARG